MTMQARAFGTAATDLDVAFGPHAWDAPATEVLARCLGAEPASVRQWSLARRLQALLAVRCADEPDAQVTTAMVCTACGSRFELALALAGCKLPVDETPLQIDTAAGRRLGVRLPRASDLDLWRGAAVQTEADLAASLVLSVDGQPPPPGFVPTADDVDAMAERLAEHDPFTALQLQAACPDCGHADSADIDLEAALLADFARQQRRLLDEVATLARAFHWSEAQILALPAWRRAHYLARLDTLEAG